MRKTSALKSPPIAWPTIVFASLVVCIWGITFTALLIGAVPWWVALILSSLSSFAAFTPMHDAAHNSIARKSWVNELVGRINGFILTAPFPAFRYLHLRHHKYTNDEHEDPDMWSGQGPRLLLPLRWLTQDLHYYLFYVRRWNQQPKAARIELITTFTVLAVMWSILIYMGFGFELLFGWLIPSRLAIMFLAYSFDYLPHKPHTIYGREDRFRATIVRPNPILTPIFLYQNYHLVHHLYPGVPFYRYVSVWRERREQIVAKGGSGRDIFGRSLTNAQLLDRPEAQDD